MKQVKIWIYATILVCGTLLNSCTKEDPIEPKRVETEEFQQALEKMMDNPDLVTLLRPLMAYNISASHKTRWIESTNNYTTQVLYRQGFQWPTTAADYVHRFVDTIIGYDYFKV